MNGILLVGLIPAMIMTIALGLVLSYLYKSNQE